MRTTMACLPLLPHSTPQTQKKPLPLPMQKERYAPYGAFTLQGHLA
ncbi:MAG: hypothetical protein ABF701_13405 [Acetobacter syzygii]